MMLAAVLLGTSLPLSFISENIYALLEHTPVKFKKKIQNKSFLKFLRLLLN